VLCGNLNARQATSQQVFKVTIICKDARFQFLSPLINQSHRPPRCVENKPTSQQAAAAIRPYRGLVRGLKSAHFCITPQMQ